MNLRPLQPEKFVSYLRRTCLNMNSFFISVIHKKGHFYKTAAINEAAASVKKNNSIIFLLDLHLDLPVNLIQTVRKVRAEN